MKINCDMGEGLDSDPRVMPHIHQANIACGGHAGGDSTMQSTVQLALDFSVSIGAHPSYPDRKNFGRQSMSMTAEALTESFLEQINALNTMCLKLGAKIDYVKPHGALNNDMVTDDSLFHTICAAIAHHSPGLAVMIQMTSRKDALFAIAQSHGLPVIWEIFADRAYEEDGRLRNRKFHDAVHQNAGLIVAQVSEIVRNARIPIHESLDYYSVDGAESMCIHGDNPPSVLAVQELAAIIQ